MSRDIEIAASLLARALREDERDGRLPKGRLIEHDEAERALTRGRYAFLGRRSLSLAPARRNGSSRPASDRGVTFHFSLTHVSMPRRARSLEQLPGDKVWVFPKRGERKAVEKLGGRYDRQHGAWHVPASSAAKAAQYRTASAARAWAGVGGSGPRSAQGVSAAVDFQRYIERAELDDERCRAQLVHDDDGPVSLGNLGDDVDERAGFWAAYAKAAARSNARLQSRIILEVPHEVAFSDDGPRLVRRLAERIVEPMKERGLPYHLAAHWPETEKGSDPRNVHFHVLYGERPTQRLGAWSWRIGRVDRSARGDSGGGGGWSVGLRDRYAEVLNDALQQVGASKRYDPRSYRESGVKALPGRHLGPRRTQLERSGVPTVLGLALAMRERVGAELALVEKQDRRRRRIALLGGDSEGGGLAVAVEALERQEIASLHDGGARRRVRAAFLEEEKRRLLERMAGTMESRQRERLCRRMERVELGLSMAKGGSDGNGEGRGGAEEPGPRIGFREALRRQGELRRAGRAAWPMSPVVLGISDVKSGSRSRPRGERGGGMEI